MFFIPTWITNLLLLFTCVLAGYQHTRLDRVNSVLNLQFITMAFSLFMVVVVTLKNYVNPWLSLAFLLIALGDCYMIIRQHRMLPPKKSFE